MTACSSNSMQSICFYLFYYYYFIIRDEFEFDDLKYCVLISVSRLTKIIGNSSIEVKTRSSLRNICNNLTFIQCFKNRTG